jgi:STE24 endopeptidase
VSPDTLSLVFLSFAVLTTLLRLWLNHRQGNCVRAHREAVPPDFATSISLADHQRAADYTAAKLRVGTAEILVDAVLLLFLTLGGGLAWIDAALRAAAGTGYFQGLLLFAAVGVIGFVVTLPTSLYRTFVIEARFGFNKLTVPLWLADLAKGAVLTVILGGPLLYAVLWLMDAMGPSWWLYVWMLWLGFNLLMLFLYPTLIAPLFNTFTPLDNPELRQRINALLARCGFIASGLFVMDGSRRSAHGNAYFTGFGRNKRIVFYDTLLEKLAPDEMEAVLAHELGHFKHRHVAKRIVLLATTSLGMLWLLGQLIDQPWFFAGLGLTEVGADRTAMALLLFSLVLPVFLFPLSPLTSALSRRHEYEADAYAAHQVAAEHLVAALVKLYRDNAATLTPDPPARGRVNIRAARPAGSGNHLRAPLTA